MPRRARIKCESGIYHIMLRGINGQQIFLCHEDYMKYLYILSDCKDICKFELLAYCLMGNHIHLLIREGNEPLEQIFKRVGVRFVRWYNNKYERTGHLFQDRFRSEPVASDEYAMTVVRYIHRNPVKAGLCQSAEQYHYSSYNEYIGNAWIIDKELICGLLGDQFEEFHKSDEDDNLGCFYSRKKSSDLEILDIILKQSDCRNITEFMELGTQTKVAAIKKIRDKGISIDDLSRLTGITKYFIKTKID